MAPVAAAVGVGGVFASGRLYVVPGRPSWNTPLTIAAFFLTALATGPLVTGHPAVAAAAVACQLACWAANLVRLARDPRREWYGTVALYRHPFGWLTAARWGLAGAGVVAALTAAPVGLALALVLAGEVVGRYLFYVTVVPLNIPGSFFGARRRH